MNEAQLAEFNEFSGYSRRAKQYNGKLWRVDDRFARDPSSKFAEGGSSAFTEYTFDAMGQAPLEYVPLPEGLLRWMEKAYLPAFNLEPTQYADVEAICHHVFRHLDYCEPYFFLTDMPITLVPFNLEHTYRLKDTKSVLDPSKMEIFRVNPEWRFQHYGYVHKLLTSEEIVEILRRDPQVPGRMYVRNQDKTVHDVLALISETVFSKYDYFRGVVQSWVDDYYESLMFDTAETLDSYEVALINDHKQLDAVWWQTITLGMLTWLKSPYGLKFLTEYHPIYSELLYWDRDMQKIRINESSGREVIATGWSLYTLKDVEKLPGVTPGTCCITKQPVHCTKLINVTAIEHPTCFCGKEIDFREVNKTYDSEHRFHACDQYKTKHPEKLAFFSYGALSNIIEKRPPDTPCERTSCPATNCKLHAGQWARVRALTDQRTKMLTSSAPH